MSVGGGTEERGEGGRKRGRKEGREGERKKGRKREGRERERKKGRKGRREGGEGEEEIHQHQYLWSTRPDIAVCNMVQTVPLSFNPFRKLW